jgi:hypothetical protein
MFNFVLQKRKLSLCLIKHGAMKTYGGVVAQLHHLHAPVALTPPGQSPLPPLPIGQVAVRVPEPVWALRCCTVINHTTRSLQAKSGTPLSDLLAILITSGTQHKVSLQSDGLLKRWGKQAPGPLALTSHFPLACMYKTPKIYYKEGAFPCKSCPRP